MIGVADGGWDGLEGMGEDALQELRGEAEFKIRRAQLHFVNELKLTLTGQRSGREYRVSRTGKLHQASAPGEPPAVLNDNLRGSAGAADPTWEGWTISGEVGIGLGIPPGGGDPDASRAYARRLEFGGIDSRGIRILARPYFEPTILRTGPAIDAILEG